MERTSKKVRSRPFIQKSEKMEAPSFNLNKSMEVEEDEENEDDENLQTFAIYYDQGNVRHRKLFREISEEFQDRLQQYPCHFPIFFLNLGINNN